MRIVLWIALGLIAVPLVADELRERGGREKAKWEWTVEERLSARFDPVLAAKRAARQPQGMGTVSGEVEPELFLPGELFSSLLAGLDADAKFRETSRAILRNRILEFGLDPQQFWRELEDAISSHVRLTSRYAALLNRLRESEPGTGTRGEIEAEKERLGPVLCRSRADALAEARRHFGAETFDRFLYTVVAPGLTIAPADLRLATAEHALFLEGGCR